MKCNVHVGCVKYFCRSCCLISECYRPCLTKIVPATCSLRRGLGHPARATAVSDRAWGLLLGTPALTETGFAPAGEEQPINDKLFLPVDEDAIGRFVDAPRGV